MDLQEYNKTKNELLKDIPKEFKDALSNYAWEQGHSAGYGEVLLYLRDLISKLDLPIREFGERIREEGYEKRMNEERYEEK